MDAIGIRLVYSMLVHKDLSIISKKGIDKEDLYDEAQKALVWVQNYVKETGEVPTPSMVSESLVLTFPLEVDPLEYASEQVRKRSLSTRLNKKLEESIKLIDSRDPDSALKVLTSTSDLKRFSKSYKITRYTEETAIRISEYEEHRKFGIKTPWESLNKATQGWVNSSFNVIAAKTNQGKSWSVCACAEDSLENGDTVLFVTMEMPERRVSRRIDAIHYKIPFGKLRDGEMSPEELGEWKGSLKEFKGELFIADKNLVRTVEDINALVQDYKPNIVYIDGGYLLESTKKSGAWENTVSVVKDLQISAEISGIPWVVTTQLGDKDEKGKETKRGPKLSGWNVRYGKEWLIYAYLFIGLHQDDDLRLARKSMLKILKMQDSDGVSTDEIYINWDLNKMDFSELKSESVGVPFGSTPFEGPVGVVEF